MQEHWKSCKHKCGFADVRERVRERKGANESAGDGWRHRDRDYSTV